jgi:hypothetical protein
MIAQTRPRRRSSQPLGEDLGLAEMIEHLPDFAELAQHRSQIEADLEGLLHCGLAVRLRLQKIQRFLVRTSGVQERRTR